jgi:hypothetical protein
MHFVAVDFRRGVGIHQVASCGPAVRSRDHGGARPRGLHPARSTRERHHVLRHGTWCTCACVRRVDDLDPTEQKPREYVETQDHMNSVHWVDMLHYWYQLIRYNRILATGACSFHELA